MTCKYNISRDRQVNYMKKYLPFILAMLLLLAFSTSVFASEPIGMIEEETIEYPFTEPYEYPIVPGTDEWRELTSLAEKIEVCHVPQMALDNMTTEALLETVMDYPLLFNMFAYDDLQRGFEAVMNYCNGLQELWTRPDLEEVLEQFISEAPYDENLALLQERFIETLFNTLQGPTLPVLEIIPWSLHYDYTPNGSRVQFLYDRTWEDHGFDSEEDWLEECEILFDGVYEKLYDSATKIRDENAAYNCHSYSFYSRSSGNRYWLQPGQAQIYLSDGSYESVSPGQAGDIGWYGLDHSAVVEEKLSNGEVIMISKWGPGGLFRHLSYDCPYEVEDGIDYYRLAD